MFRKKREVLPHHKIYINLIIELLFYIKLYIKLLFFISILTLLIYTKQFSFYVTILMQLYNYKVFNLVQFVWIFIKFSFTYIFSIFREKNFYWGKCWYCIIINHYYCICICKVSIKIPRQQQFHYIYSEPTQFSW